ncbi:hypothetical protein Y886_05360 [Xanthomonas hyacinthi DSM 19077]|nr:hypothetical protein Y886_05360 [Xanthomonas hyacinthi DSM 19077]
MDDTLQGMDPEWCHEADGVFLQERFNRDARSGERRGFVEAPAEQQCACIKTSSEYQEPR